MSFISHSTAQPLVSCPADTCAKSIQLLDDRFGGGSPLEGLAVGVVMSDELIDALHELLDAGERSAPDGLVGDQCKEALDLIEPGAVGRDEVHVPAWPTGQH